MGFTVLHVWLLFFTDIHSICYLLIKATDEGNQDGEDVRIDAWLLLRMKPGWVVNGNHVLILQLSMANKIQFSFHQSVGHVTLGLVSI